MPEHYGSQTHYPELRDETWAREHLDLGTEGIARLLGCAPKFASDQLAKLGFGSWTHWTPLEVAILEQFYPYHPVLLLASALGRSRMGLYAKAHKMQVRGRWGRQPCNDADRSNFWAEWRTYLRINLGRWRGNGWWEGAMKLAWRLARPELECGEGCPLKAECRKDGKLPCEKMTLGERLTVT